LSLKPGEKKTVIFKYGAPPANNYYNFMDCTYIGVKREGGQREIIASNEDLSSLLFNFYKKKRGISMFKAMKLFAIGPADDFFVEPATEEIFHYFREKGAYKNEKTENAGQKATYILKEIGWSSMFKK